MTHPSRRTVLAGAAAALLTAPHVARAQARRVTVASLLGPDKPETRVWDVVAAELERRLPGRFDLRVVPNAALGGEREVAEGARLGSVQASLSTVSALSSWVPSSQILDLPFVFSDRAHVRRALEGAEGERLKALFAEEGFVVLGFITYGARQLLAKGPVTTPAGIRGKRIRVIQSPLHTELWRAYGAEPTPIPIPETYNALRSGVVDAMDLTIAATAGFKLYEVVPYMTLTAHIWATGVLYVSATFWDGLSEEERAAFAAAGAVAAPSFDDLIVADEERSAAEIIAGGGTILEPEDLAAWREGARPVWESFAPVVGGLERIEALALA
jgi:tripartite ATP-independent transporter DctP family solute receptor